MPLARKLRKKKLYRRLLFCASQPDHYDNKLQAYVTLARACFYKGYYDNKLQAYVTLARASFYEGYISRKSSSLPSVICSMRSLDAHGSVQKKKMKLLEIAGNEKIKQE